MKFKIIALISIFFASGGLAGNGNLKSLEDELTFFEWSGPEIFVRHLKNENVDSCEFLTTAEERHQKMSPVVRRVLLSLEYSECPSKKQVVEKYLKSKEPLLREAAIRLASSLATDQRKEMEPRIKKLKATDNDPAVASAIFEFFQRR